MKGRLSMGLALTMSMGCATVTGHTEPVGLPSGGLGWAASCNSAIQCWRLMGLTCPGGYEVVDGHDGMVSTDAVMGYGVYASRTSQRVYFLYRCIEGGEK